MERELISVILPAYNAERFIQEAINSILAQTYKNFELIVLNDGSTDRTEEIILSYNDPRIRYIKNEKNLKLIKTLNKGIDLAHGEYIARMDADDISLPTRFEEELKLFKRNPELGIVSCYPNNISDSGKYLSRSSSFVCTQTQSCRFVSAIEPPFLHPGIMAKSDVMRMYKYNDSPEYYHIEDFELWHRMLVNGVKCEVSPLYLVNYRDTQEGICNTHNDDQIVNGQKLTILHLQSWDICGYKERAMEAIKYKIANDYTVFSEAIELIDRLQIKYLETINVNRIEKREISVWCHQRKLAIVLSSILKSNGLFKYRLLTWLLFHPLLFLSKNSFRYIVNRLIRLRNEKRDR